MSATTVAAEHPVASQEAAPVTQASQASVPDSGSASDQHVYKSMPRSKELKHQLDCRINRTIGQLNGIKQMVDDDRYCGDVLTQLAAVESAVKSISRIVMQDHLESCVVEKIQQGDTEVIDEVMRLFKKFM